MIDFCKKNINYLVKALCILLLLISFSIIYVNYNHQSYLNDSYIVSKTDTYLNDYMKNMDTIKKNIDNYQYDSMKYTDSFDEMSSFKQSIDSCFIHLTDDKTIYILKEKDSLSYYDIYELNNNFYNNLVNNCWVTNIKKINLKTKYFNKMNVFQDEINILLNNSKNLKNRLLSNSLYTYGSINSKYMVYNPLIESYNEVSRIYDDMSKIILDMSNYLVTGESYENEM